MTLRFIRSFLLGPFLIALGEIWRTFEISKYKYFEFENDLQICLNV